MRQSGNNLPARQKTPSGVPNDDLRIEDQQVPVALMSDEELDRAIKRAQRVMRKRK